MRMYHHVALSFKTKDLWKLQPNLPANPNVPPFPNIRLIIIWLSDDATLNVSWGNFDSFGCQKLDQNLRSNPSASGWAPEWKRHWLLPQRQSQWPAYEEYIEAWTIPQIPWVNVCEHLMPFNEISWHNESRLVPLKSREDLLDLLRISNGSHTKKNIQCKSGSETFSESNL